METPLFRRASDTEPEPDITDLFTPRNKRDEAKGTFFDEMSLIDIISDDGLREHLLCKHTFVHGKIGFHSHIISSTLAAAQLESDAFHEVFVENGLPKTKIPQRIKLVPRAESLVSLNRMVSRAFGKAESVWLVAPPSSINTHLLMNFSNFFVAVSRDSDVAPFYDILRLNDHMLDTFASSPIPGAFLITNYDKAVEDIGSNNIAVIRLKSELVLFWHQICLNSCIFRHKWWSF